MTPAKIRPLRRRTKPRQQGWESGAVTGKARGLTARLRRVTVEQADLLMRGHARSNNASMRVVADALVAVGLQV